MLVQDTSRDQQKDNSASWPILLACSDVLACADLDAARHRACRATAAVTLEHVVRAKSNTRIARRSAMA